MISIKKLHVSFLLPITAQRIRTPIIIGVFHRRRSRIQSGPMVQRRRRTGICSAGHIRHHARATDHGDGNIQKGL